MKPHAIKEYIKYLYKAKNLHGVHSPFAYDFAENVLCDREDVPTPTELKPYSWLPAQYYFLLGKVVSYYKYNNLLCLTHDNEEEPTRYDFLLLKDNRPGDWVRLFNKYLPHLKSDCGCMIAGIHKSKRHSAKWDRLRKHPKVMMSIDLYGVGLLFFRKEFKEKQHFVLKY